MKRTLLMLSVLSSLMLGCAKNNGVTNHDHAPATEHNSSRNRPSESHLEAGPVERVAAKKSDSKRNMVFIKGGSFRMGTPNGMEYERPVRSVTVKSFWMDKHEVTVAEFEKFVNETAFVTEAEKIGWSGVFSTEEGGWIRCEKISWRNPDCGTKKPNPNEPVTQVSWNDAVAYAAWAGKRLPTEAEFEYAIRGGLDQNEYSWGNELKPNGKPVANWWQGSFPEEDTKEDGFSGRAPVMSFPPNGYGLYEMGGNVWEWTADWYAADYYKWGATENPTGPKSGNEKSIRGGSWLCAENYCTNYRAAGRSKSPTDTALNNLGFRLVADE